MTLKEALEILSDFTDANHQQVEEKLRIMERPALHYQAVLNIRSECRLPKEAWESLFKGLLAAAPDPEEIRRAITDCFRSWSLCGPALAPPHPTVFGRAVTVARFCELLVVLRKYDSVTTARRAVRNMLSKSRDVVARRWYNFDLGRYLMWSTFNPVTDGGDPFDGMPSSADGIGGLLGLDRNERGQPLLLLQFTLPADIVPLFPTIAEAYAGDKWPYFFRPAPEGAPCGMTMPWPEYEDQAPRPEVVHKVIRGAQLSAPLREVS